MKKKLYPGFAVLATGILAMSSLSTLVPVYAAQGGSTTAQTQHALPVLKVTPSDGATVVRPDTPVQIVLDPSSPNFNRFHEQFLKGAYQVTLNGQNVASNYDDQTHTITVQHNLLARYSQFTVGLAVKSSLHASQSTSNTTESTSFQTGSAIGEATHVQASLASSDVSVLQGGSLNVQAQDDYGDPATGATVSVSGQGSGNARVASDFSTPAVTSMTDGKVAIPLTDHSAENVSLHYTVQDNTYHDTVDTSVGSGAETFLPGPTAKINAETPSEVFVGSSNSVSGEALDVYGNGVVDGTAISLNSQRGSGSNSTTSGGDFTLSYVSPTVKGNDSLSLGADDSHFSVSRQVYDRAEHPAKVDFTGKNLVAGHRGDVTFNVYDEYGNLVENDESLTLQFGGGVLPNETVSTNNGVADFKVTAPTKAQSFGMTLGAGSNGVSFTIPAKETVVHDVAAKASAIVPTLKVGQSATITGQLVDQYGNSVDSTSVSFGALGSTQTDANGHYSLSFTVPNGLKSISATVSGSPINLLAPNGDALASLPVTVQAAVAPITVKANRVLLIRDNDAWNNPVWENRLSANKVPYDIANTYTLPNVNLSNYDRVIIESDQTQTMYNEIQAKMPAINAWVQNGGILIFDGADMGWHSGQWSAGPDGISNYHYYSNYNYLINGNTPFTKGVPSTIWGNYASHNVFVNLPANAQVLMSDTANGSEPTVADFTDGQGFVFATAETVEYAVAFNQGSQALFNNVWNYYFMGQN